MLWILLSIFRSILVVLKILFIRYDNTPFIMFPFIVNIIAGSISLTYFTLYYKEHFTTEFSKPEVYLFTCRAIWKSVSILYHKSIYEPRIFQGIRNTRNHLAIHYNALYQR